MNAQLADIYMLVDWGRGADRQGAVYLCVCGGVCVWWWGGMHGCVGAGEGGAAGNARGVQQT